MSLSLSLNQAAAGVSLSLYFPNLSLDQTRKSPNSDEPVMTRRIEAGPQTEGVQEAVEEQEEEKRAPLSFFA